MPDEIEIQAGALINAYLAASQLPAFKNGPFFAKGQMLPAFDWLWENTGKLSHGEQLVFQVAKEIWTWQAEAKIADLCNSLSIRLVSLTFSLYLARLEGPKAIDRWIAKYGGKHA